MLASSEVPAAQKNFSLMFFQSNMAPVMHLTLMGQLTVQNIWPQWMSPGVFTCRLWFEVITMGTDFLKWWESDIWGVTSMAKVHWDGVWKTLCQSLAPLLKVSCCGCPQLLLIQPYNSTFGNIYFWHFRISDSIWMVHGFWQEMPWSENWCHKGHHHTWISSQCVAKITWHVLAQSNRTNILICMVHIMCCDVCCSHDIFERIQNNRNHNINISST